MDEQTNKQRKYVQPTIHTHTHRSHQHQHPHTRSSHTYGWTFDSHHCHHIELILSLAKYWKIVLGSLLINIIIIHNHYPYRCHSPSAFRQFRLLYTSHWQLTISDVIQGDVDFSCLLFLQLVWYAAAILLAAAVVATGASVSSQLSLF